MFSEWKWWATLNIHEHFDHWLCAIICVDTKSPVRSRGSYMRPLSYSILDVLRCDSNRQSNRQDAHTAISSDNSIQWGASRQSYWPLGCRTLRWSQISRATQKVSNGAEEKASRQVIDGTTLQFQTFAFSFFIYLIFIFISGGSDNDIVAFWQIRNDHGMLLPSYDYSRTSAEPSSQTYKDISRLKAKKNY